MPVHPRPQPLVARYSPGLLPRLREALAEERSMTRLAEALGGARLGEEEMLGLGDPAWMLANANDRDDLARIEAEIVRRQAA